MVVSSRAGAAALAVVLGVGLAACGREALPIDSGSGGQSSSGQGGGGTCEPAEELCGNGADDDCDGEIDEGCACSEGAAQPCYSGPAATLNVGQCAQGEQVCQKGQWSVCKGEILPDVESCDGLDNNCDGLIDNGNPGGGSACNVGLPGLCGQGEKKCQSGQFVCAQVTFASPETCDGLDNNCNGEVDDGDPGGGPCDTGKPGPCGPGTATCSGGMVQCVSLVSPAPEICDGIDNDCDGVIDDGAATAKVFFSETFTGNEAGWTLDAEWQIGPAATSSGQSFGNPDPALDHSAIDDSGVAGVVIGGNAAQNMQHPFRWLTSPLIAVDPAAPEVYLQYWRWLNSDFAPWMTNRVEIWDAASGVWTMLWQSGGSPGVADSAWTKQLHTITAFAQSGSIRVRFGFNVGQNGAFVVSQWNVDDVVVTTKACD